MKVEVKVPAVGESITEATIAEWAKADGDQVERDEVLLVLETDKASVDVVAENAGKLSIKVQEGETVEIGAVVGEIDTDAAGASTSAGGSAETPPPIPAEASAQASPGKDIHPDLKNHMSPAVAKLVADNKVDTSGIKGTGKDGRLTKADVLNAPTQKASAAPTPTEAKSSAPPLPTAKSASTGEAQTRKPMSQLRKTIAKRLVEAQQTAAILTTFNEVDMSHLMSLRSQYKEDFKKKYDIGLGFMGFFVKAVCEALQEVPAVNAQIDGTDLIYNHGCHVGIAVSTPKGLVVPVIR
ncbi:MAG: 2-oxo acid dehydrogenase subunit E2, partial [Bdellovibrionales bacterium]